MAVYVYECEFCKDSYKKIEHSMSKDPEILCDICKNKMYRIVTGGQGFIMIENNDATSCKPDSYFANAEWNRKKREKKNYKMKREKLLDKDSDTVKKLRNKAQNYQNSEKVYEGEVINRQLDNL